MKSLTRRARRFASTHGRSAAFVGSARDGEADPRGAAVYHDPLLGERCHQRIASATQIVVESELRVAREYEHACLACHELDIWDNE